MKWEEYNTWGRIEEGHNISVNHLLSTFSPRNLVPTLYYIVNSSMKLTVPKPLPLVSSELKVLFLLCQIKITMGMH